MNWNGLSAWFSAPPGLSLMPVYYDGWLVALSIVLAVLSGIAAMSALRNASSATGPERKWLVLAGGLALGGGTWAMHFVGMLAVDICQPVRYDPWYTAASMVPSLLASALAVRLLTASPVNCRQLALSALLMAAGIGSMHYSGMAAMRMEAQLRFDVMGFTVSLLAAFPLVWVALWLRLHLLHVGRWRPIWAQVASGSIVGLAMSAMHYMGQAAARFYADVQLLFHRAGHGAHNQEEFAFMLASFVLLLLALVSVLSNLFRNRSLVRQLEDASQRHRSMLDNLPDVVMRLSSHAPWQIVATNCRVHPMLGLGPDQMLGESLLATALAPVDPAVLASLEADLSRAVHEDEVIERVYRYRHPSGDARWLALAMRRGIKEDDHELYQLDAVINDVTEQQALKSELQVAQDIINGANDAIISKSLDSTITSWNAGAEALFGYTAEEAVGMSVTRLFRPQDVCQERELIRAIAQQRTVPAFEAVRVRKDGRPVDVLVSLSPILDASGLVTGAATISRDITEKKANDALRSQKIQAEKLAASRASFLANMSHELRTPMNAVLGFTSVLMETDLSDAQRAHLKVVHDSGSHLLRLLNDILDAAKLERSAMELDLQAFDLHAQLASLEAHFNRRAAAKGLSFRVVMAPDLPIYFRGDSLRLRQILFNLVDNAIKFTEQGQVEVRVERQLDQLVIEIADTGIGVTPEQAARVFEPFTQADSSMSRRFGGTGLGTYICHQLVQLMHGSIEMESHLGMGSVFCVRLPLPLARSEEARETSPRMPGRLPRLRIMVVDDVRVNLDLVHLLLGANHELALVDNGADAVAMAATQQFDVILMDVQMPGMDGLQATRLIRADETRAGRTPVPIIALTASVLERDRVQASDAGMNGFAVKPLDWVDLSRDIATVLKLDLITSPSLQSDGGHHETSGALLIDEVAGLRIWSDLREAWIDGLTHFRSGLADQVSAISTWLAQGAREQALAAIHALRGTAGAVAASVLYHRLDAIETLLRSAQDDQAAGQVNALQSEAVATQAAIDKLLQGEVAMSPSDRSKQTRQTTLASEIVDTLRGHLIQSEVPPQALLDQLRAALGKDYLSSDALRLQKALDNYEYSDAMSALDTLQSWLADNA